MALFDFGKFYYCAETQKPESRIQPLCIELWQNPGSLCKQQVKWISWMMDIDGANMGRKLSKATHIQGHIFFMTTSKKLGSHNA